MKKGYKLGIHLAPSFITLVSEVGFQESRRDSNINDEKTGGVELYGIKKRTHEKAARYERKKKLQERLELWIINNGHDVDEHELDAKIDAELEANCVNRGEAVKEDSIDQYPVETVTLEETAEAPAEDKLKPAELEENPRSIREITPTMCPIGSLVSVGEETEYKADGSTLGETKVSLPCSEEPGAELGEEEDAETNGMKIHEGSSARRENQRQ